MICETAEARALSEWIERVFDPQTKAQAKQIPHILMCDGFGTHETLEILEYCFENNIILCHLPSHTSHKLQSCDVWVFSPLKAAYRDQVERLYWGGVNNIGKEHFTSLYSPARERALTFRNIKAAWAASGLFPFNPDRVLRDTPKPVSLTVPKAYELEVGPCPQGEVLQASVTSEALTSLHNLITQDFLALDEVSKQRLQRHVQKLANAAQISFAECALLRDQTQFLSRMNNEAKVHWLTKSVVLGKAKVMSYEDIEEAWAKRAAKEKAMAGKGKHGWKPKSPAPKADASVPVTPVARMIWDCRFYSSNQFLGADSRRLHNLSFVVVRKLAFIAPLA